jgi:hypothetical protein
MSDSDKSAITICFTCHPTNSVLRFFCLTTQESIKFNGGSRLSFFIIITITIMHIQNHQILDKCLFDAYLKYPWLHPYNMLVNFYTWMYHLGGFASCYETLDNIQI